MQQRHSTMEKVVSVDGERTLPNFQIRLEMMFSDEESSSSFFFLITNERLVNHLHFLLNSKITKCKGNAAMTVASIYVSVVYVIIPIFAIIQIWRNHSNDLTKWICYVACGGIYVSFMCYTGAWCLIIFPYYLRYLVFITFLISTIKSFFNCKRVFLPLNASRIGLCSVTGLVCVIQGWRMCTVFGSTFYIPDAVNLEFPLKKGDYCIAHGGNSLVINHHYDVSAQKYAIDITKLNNLGLRCNSLNPCALKDYNIFGDTIYSPCNGRIVNLVNEYQDLAPSMMDPEHPAGNYLAIEIDGSKSVIILAHIMKDSFLVKNGDSVQQGQQLANVGNSGNTSEPHLHMHVVKGEDFLYDGEGIPMKFNNRFLVRNDIVN